MKKRNWITRSVKLSIVSASLLATIGAGQILSQRARAKAGANTPQIFAQPPFRYAIIYDDPALNSVGRDLHILIDPSEFTEGNLRTLFALLAQRFKGQPGFTAYIETSLQDIQTPEERDSPGYSETPGNPKGGKTPAATIRHSEGADMLYIYLPSRATDHPIKVDLRLAGSRTENP